MERRQRLIYLIVAAQRAADSTGYGWLGNAEQENSDTLGSMLPKSMENEACRNSVAAKDRFILEAIEIIRSGVGAVYYYFAKPVEDGKYLVSFEIMGYQVTFITENPAIKKLCNTKKNIERENVGKKSRRTCFILLKMI